MEIVMETYIELLQGYYSRDKILRTLSYATAFASGTFKGKVAKDLLKIATNISSARTVNRLLDDVLMWQETRTWGASEKDPVSQRLVVLANIAIQLYYPIEKVAWAADNEIISVKPKPWWDAGIAAWAIYLLLNILRSIRQLIYVRSKIIKVLKQRKLESPERSGQKDAEFMAQLSELKSIQRKEFLSLIKNLADITMCINWLPLKGFLWSGRLSVPRNAFFGTISSLIGLYLSIENYHANRKKT